MKAAELGHGRGLLLAFAALALSACGGNSKSKVDGGLDGGAHLDAGNAKDAGGFIRRIDASTLGTNAVPMCDRFTPSSCAAGQECHLVISRAAGSDAGTTFLIYPGCVAGVSSRPLGSPCTQFDMNHPYMAKGVTDEIYVDPCAPGLYCAPDLKIRGSYSCQSSCEPPSSSSAGLACPSTQVCDPAGDPQGDTQLQFICHAGDSCDPSDPTSCGAGFGCFLRPSDTGTSALSQCLPVSDMPIPDGQPCQYINDCNRGSSCWGPTRLQPTDWMSTTCRRSCEVANAASGNDGGAEEGDGGVVGASGCSVTQTCIALSESKLDVSHVVPAPGFCE